LRERLKETKTSTQKGFKMAIKHSEFKDIGIKNIHQTAQKRQIKIFA